MRYIDKSKRCETFDVYMTVNYLDNDWNSFDSNEKLRLYQHLHKEQGGLCIYCQQKIPPKKQLEPSSKQVSHIEHIRPRNLKDENGEFKYKCLTFIYCNLTVCCEGFEINITESTNKTSLDRKQEFCEFHKDHSRKSLEYDEDKFLNPTEVHNIEDYFIYDDETFKIEPRCKIETDERYIKAAYTIEKMCLNHEKLLKMRELAYKCKWEKDENILPPFYSMLLQLKDDIYE